MLVSEVLQELRGTNSNNDKLKILERTKSPLLEKFFEMTLNPLKRYYIKKIPDYTPSAKYSKSLLECLDIIESELSTRKVTGNAAIELLKDLLETSEDPEAIECLIKRDLDCGVSVNSINKVYKGLIKEYPVLLAEQGKPEQMKSITFPCIVQEKSDGVRINVVKENNEVVFYTRQGRCFQNEILASYFKNLDFNGVLDGELLLIDDNGVEGDRKTSSGIVNKALKETITDKESKELGIRFWDFISLEEFKSHKGAKPYNERLEITKEIISRIDSKKFTLVDTRIANNMEEASDFYTEMRSQNKEGVLFKNIKSLWENKRSKNLQKWKAEETCSLLVVDIEEGTGKFEGGLGALVCETADKRLRVSVGTGFKMEERGLTNRKEGDKLIQVSNGFDYRSYIGKIVEVKYNQIIKSKTEDSLHCLFLPVFLETRVDKNQADTLDHLK